MSIIRWYIQLKLRVFKANMVFLAIMLTITAAFQAGSALGDLIFPDPEPVHYEHIFESNEQQLL